MRARRSSGACSARWSRAASSPSSRTAASRTTTRARRCAPTCAMWSSTSARRCIARSASFCTPSGPARRRSTPSSALPCSSTTPRTRRWRRARRRACWREPCPRPPSSRRPTSCATPGTVVDVGGGAGTLLAEVLRQRPEIGGVLLERPGMLEHARGYLAEQGVADRCELVEGDFFASVPAGGDVYVLKSVLHDWDDERCVAILQQLPRRDGSSRAAGDHRAAAPAAHDAERPDAPRGAARPDHARVRGRPRAHRGGVHAAARSGRPSFGAHHTPRRPGRTCWRPSSSSVMRVRASTGSER